MDGNILIFIFILMVIVNFINEIINIFNGSIVILIYGKDVIKEYFV